MKYELFISHSSKENNDIAIPLRNALSEAGIDVWMDNKNITPGRKPIREIDIALASTNMAIVILSPAYFESKYTMMELDAILALGLPVITILHNISHREIEAKSPLTSTFIALDSKLGIDNIVINIVSEMMAPESKGEVRDSTTVIGVSGASCSGKTWLAKKLESSCQMSVTMFDLDSFYRPLEEVNALDHKHDNPQSIDYVEAASCLSKLLSGKPTIVPIYNFLITTNPQQASIDAVEWEMN